MKRRNVEAWAGIICGTGAAVILIAFGASIERAKALDPTPGFGIGAILSAFALGLIVALLARDEEQ